VRIPQTGTDEAVLNEFRGPGKCELCGARCAAREPHHFLRCGMGGGGRLDVRINLVSLGKTFQCPCHNAIHHGTMSRAEEKTKVLGAISKRMGHSPEAIEASLLTLRQMAKGSIIPAWLQKILDPST
jgi:hypothetical protein